MAREAQEDVKTVKLAQLKTDQAHILLDEDVKTMQKKLTALEERLGRIDTRFDGHSSID